MISTKDIPTGGKGAGVPKTLQPGNRVVKINSIYLDKYPWGDEAYNLMLDCEGTDLGKDFEGFFINKTNEELGRHKGQVGRVRASEWAYQDKELPGGIIINRDLEIVKMLKNICVATDCLDWFETEDGKHDTIEGLISHMNEQSPYRDVFVNSCLGGKEYQNKGGYTNYDLFFPKFSKAGIPFEITEIDSTLSQVYTFTENDHIRKKKVKEVESFEADDDGGFPSAADIGADTQEFEL